MESTSGVHAFASKEDVTGHFGTPMKETGGLSQPLRSLNRPNKTKQNKTNKTKQKQSDPEKTSSGTDT